MPFKPLYCTQSLPTELKCTNLATHILKLGSTPVSSIDRRASIYLCITCLQSRIETLNSNQFTLIKLMPTDNPASASRLKTPYLKQPEQKTYTPTPLPKSPEQLKLLREQFNRALLSDKIRLRQEIIEYFGIDPLDPPT